MHTRSINGPPDWVVHGTVRRAAGAGVNAFQRSATAVLALEDLTFSAQHSAARTVRSTVTQAGCYPAHNTRAERGRDRELHRADESSAAFDVPRPSRHQCGAGAFLSCVFHLLFITRRISLSLSDPLALFGSFVSGSLVCRRNIAFSFSVFIRDANREPLHLVTHRFPHWSESLSCVFNGLASSS
jgi:hypothetical protein